MYKVSKQALVGGLQRVWTRMCVIQNDKINTIPIFFYILNVPSHSFY